MVCDICDFEAFGPINGDAWICPECGVVTGLMVFLSEVYYGA